LQATAAPQEQRGKGELPAIDLTAIVPHGEKSKPPLDDFSRDVAVDTASKRLFDPESTNWRGAAVYLAGHEKGLPVLEEIIILFRITDNIRWTEAFAIYAAQVQPGAVPDKMIGEYVADLQLQHTRAGNIAAMKRLGAMGRRAREALPVLEWIMSFSPDPEQVEAATEAIFRIDRRRAGGMYGC
jgi:hypothetical protein